MKIRERYERIKLFCGVIYASEDIFLAAREKLVNKIGSIDISTAPLPFTGTGYYKDDMGDCLKRRFLSFKEPVSPENLSAWKIITNEIEEGFYKAGPNPRQVNIDPGYINLARVVLFSAKDFYHRIYLGDGIFAEVTLYFQDNGFRFLPWTYPDYKKEEYLDFFMKARKVYREQILEKKDMV